ncbi:dihydrofolate reductase family protein [Amycolatopsis sp. NPDC051371]|uniref:dihydrofolate reductase family protein n=1 Tax=Amycolatopsis sp. NPDC051371 TaxID=3155800 RepID=UPI0034201C91
MAEEADQRGAKLHLRGGVARVQWPSRRILAPPLLVWFTEAGSAAEPAVTGVVVISAGLRDFPAAREVLEWSAAHAADLGADPGRLLVGGDGSGAAVAAMVARYARAQGWPTVFEVGRRARAVKSLEAKDDRMRKLVSNLFVSLDGVVEAPDKWSLPYWSDEIAASVDAGMAAADAMLLGRVTYENFASAWPDRTVEDDEGADFMNKVRKYVLSTTLSEVTWRNSVLLPGNPASAIRDLKAETGGDIMTSGSGTTVRWLLSEGLVDELNLLLYPVVVGTGKRLFPAEGPNFPLTLKTSTAFGNGVVQLTYAQV